MRQINKLFILSFLSVLLLSLELRAQEANLAYVDFAPYEYQEHGTPKGILVEIVQTLFNRVNVPLKLQFLPFKRAYDDVLQGKLTGLFNFYKTDERLPLFDFSEPIIENPLVFFVRKDSEIKFENLESLKGLKLGGMIGYTYGTEFDNSNLFTIERVSSHESNFKKLFFGRIDAYPSDKLVGIYIAKKEKLLPEIKILSKPLKVMLGHIGFQKGKHNELIIKINNEIKKMKESEEIDKMVNDYLEKL